MATVTRRHPHVAILHNVRYDVYLGLARDPANGQRRMAYHDGTLEIVTLRLRRHERPSARLRLLVSVVAEELGLEYEGTDSATFTKAGPGPFQGVGKEPDKSFYIANLGRLPQDREPDLDAGDPPPDLWIEVDNRVSSAGRLPIYAALGVPEVWRYRAGSKRLQFLGLAGAEYETIGRSPSLPILTPALVLEALAFGEGVVESAWLRYLRDWVRRLVADQAPGA